MNRKTIKQITFTILRVTISFTLLGLLFWLIRNQISEIWETIYRCDKKFVIIAICVMFGQAVMLAYRLKMIFQDENLYIALWDSLKLTLIGYFFNNFMPTTVGGDIIKAHYASLSKHIKGEKLQYYASVFIDRVIGLYTLLFIATMALAFNWEKLLMDIIPFLLFFRICFYRSL